MLNKFIQSHREEIVARAGMMAAKQSASSSAQEPQISRVPIFLDQLIERLRDDDRPSTGDLAASAASHGKNMLQEGFTIVQVVQGYGNVCQIVTALAIEEEAPITTDEFRMLNRCLDQATAEAVGEYEHQRDRIISDNETERLGFLAHEMRNKLNSAMIAFDILKQGSVGVGG